MLKDSNIILSIIIVTYNNEHTIRDCLDSIVEFNDIDDALEIIVIDNSSIDCTSSILKDYEKNNIIKFLPNKNNGFGAGNNLGVSHSSGKFLFFLNPDTILIEPIFNVILNHLSKGKSSIGGFHLISKKGETMPSFGIMPERLGILSSTKLLHFLLRFMNLKLYNCFPWGAALYMPKKLFQSVGQFDENFFLNYEEPDLIHRINKWPIRINKEKIVHLESVSKPKGKLSINYYFESEKKYFNKYFEEKIYTSYKKVYVIRCKIKKCLYFFLGKKLSEFECNMLRYYE